ncbi:hypothetical protein GCM10017559_56870 [Streptosporangium longisporum]|uniref:Transposase IS116/IS110/IS902 C-terminal domain-containing protein n=1 Tax=Streptosporangium longisporum TaxID=46187 RepID=A0ABN3YAB7_9ACTN
MVDSHVLAVRLFAEIGDDRTRFVDARALKAYAGAAPSPVPPEMGAALSEGSEGEPVPALEMDAVLESSRVRRTFSHASARLIIVAAYGRPAGEGREVTHAAH